MLVVLLLFAGAIFGRLTCDITRLYLDQSHDVTLIPPGLTHSSLFHDITGQPLSQYTLIDLKKSSTDILYFLFLQGKFMILKHIHPKWVSAVWYPTIPGPPPVPLMTRPTWYLTYQSQAGAGLVLKNRLPVPLMTHPIWFHGYQSPRIAAVRVVPPLRMLWCQLRCPLLARGRVIPLPYYVGASLIASPSPDRTRLR